MEELLGVAPGDSVALIVAEGVTAPLRVVVVEGVPLPVEMPVGEPLPVGVLDTHHPTLGEAVGVPVGVGVALGDTPRVRDGAADAGV